MKNFFHVRVIGLLALLASSAGSAASLNVVASNLNPNVGDVFTLTLTAVGFTQPVGGITLLLTTSGNVTLQSVALPTGATDPLRAATGTFLVNNNPTFDWLPGAEIPTGTFAMGTFTFLRTAVGMLNIAFSDDGGTQSGWFDGNTADYIPGTVYNNPNWATPNPPQTVTTLISGRMGITQATCLQGLTVEVGSGENCM